MGTFGDKQVDPFMTSTQVASHALRYTFNEHFEQAGTLYADCKLLREQGTNPKEYHDLDPDHS